MKALNIFLASAVLVCTAVAMHFNDMKYMNKLNDILNIETRDLSDRPPGPAINYTWPNWALGPTCHDISKYSFVDLSDDTQKKVTEALDGVLAYGMELMGGLKLGMGLGVTYNGKTVYSKHDGTTSETSGKKPTDDTIISIGSITKMFTSFMLNKLMEDGTVDESDPVTKYYNEDHPPVFKPVNPYDSVAGASAVTLETLAGQTSGLLRESACPLGQFCEEDDIMTTDNMIPLYHQPYTRPHYSNHGFSLLGRCCERAVQLKEGKNISYEQWVEENILAGLGMTNSGFNYTDDVVSRMAIGYDYNGTGLEVDELFAKSLFWSNPAGGLYSTMKDMLSFANHLAMKDGVLSENGYSEYFLPGVGLHDGVSSYGKYGWEVAYSNGFTILTKGGLVGGFGTAVVVIPELKIGSFTYVNIESGVFPSIISSVAMNAIIPLIVNEIETKQPKHDYPDVVDDLLGGYGGNGAVLFTMKKTKEIKSTGVFAGTYGSYNFVSTYDAEATKAYNTPNVYFFRLHQVPDDILDSCFALASLGIDDSLALFEYSETYKSWFVTVADEISTFQQIEQYSSSEPYSESSESSASVPFVNFVLLVAAALYLLASFK